MTFSILNDLRTWSREVLEVPNKHLNGLPACPYARRAWVDDKVDVIETDNIFSDTITACDNFKDSKYELVVVASFKKPAIEAFEYWVDFLNEDMAKRDLHLMGFHPDFGAYEAELDFLYDHEWESRVEDDYCMVFIQSLSQVDDASKILEAKGYYDVFPVEEFNELVLKRRERRHGNEATSNEA